MQKHNHLGEFSLTSEDPRLVGVAIITLFTVLLFLIWDHPLFILLISLCFGIIGYIALRKEPEPTAKLISLK